MEAEEDCSKWVCVIKEALGGPPCASAADAAGDAAAGDAPAGDAAAGDEKKEGEKEKEIVE